MENNEVRGKKNRTTMEQSQKKSHKKEEVKRRETMRREKKKRKRKISRQYRGNGKLCSNWEQISRN